MAFQGGEGQRAAAVAALQRGRGDTAWTRTQMTAFFDGLAAGINGRNAAAAAGIDHAAACRRRVKDAEFGAVWDDAVTEGIAHCAIETIAEALDATSAASGERKADLATAMKLIAWVDAREKRHGRGGVQVACMPIDEVENILRRRLAAVEKRLEKAG